MLQRVHEAARPDAPAAKNRTSEVVVGERLREARRAMSLSLQQVASRVGISVATLSRIENGKQGVDLRLFLQLTALLECDARDLLLENPALSTPSGEDLHECMLRLGPAKRTRLWRGLAESLRQTAERQWSRGGADALSLQVEELLAQMDLIAAEIASIRDRMRNR